MKRFLCVDADNIRADGEAADELRPGGVDGDPEEGVRARHRGLLHRPPPALLRHLPSSHPSTYKLFT